LKRFNILGALAQLVEQWPFKPFVTGSNPVRPKVFSYFLFLILFLSSNLVSASNTIEITRDDGITLNANLSESLQNDSIYMIVHGTRGFKTMEIIKSLEEKIILNGHDVLSINLSYGVTNRDDSFLSCDIKHTHNEHESVREIISWYQYLLSKNYKKIIFVGHSRGGFNIVQASELIGNKDIELHLLAPIVDTYKGTRDYYMSENNLPYDQIIQDNDEYIISDQYSQINFLFCENAQVSSSTFRSYLDFTESRTKYPFTFNIMKLLNESSNKVSIYSGSADEILLDSYKRFESLNKENIKHFIIEDGDHFFRDIYLDDVIDLMFQ
tara:strand:- start:4132 stop:5106 length:975 start_codon:yes stop_codon:yes gene_type:complete